MNFVFPAVLVLLHVANNLPKMVKTIAADVHTAKLAKSDGGTKVTAEEITIIVGHAFAQLAEDVVPIVAKANGVKLDMAA